MQIISIEEFIQKVEIPKVKKQTKTFLGIARMPHYENVISNIYSFYFKPEEVHGMKELFLSSLVDLINQSELGQSKNFLEFDDFTVETEFTTKKRGRIDILLRNEAHAIIIENKIYHTLNNDLNDYWNSVSVVNNNEEKKIGIVLTLKKTPTKNSNYINITHLEFMQAVMKNLGRFMLDAREKYIVYLKDLYQNIVNMSKSNLEVKDLKFYFSNQKKIHEVTNFFSAIKSHVPSQVEEASQLIDEDFNLPKSKGDGNRVLRYFISPKNKDLMITIYFEKLLTEKWISLIVEMKYDLLKNKELYKSIDFYNIENNLLRSDEFYKNDNTTWAHFASKRYTLNEEEISDLKNFIVNKLNEDGFLSIYRKLNDFVPKK